MKPTDEPAPTSDRDIKPANLPKPDEWQAPGQQRPPHRRGDVTMAMRKRNR